MSLSAKNCVPCRGGVSPLSLEQAQSQLAHAPGWELAYQGTRIQRRFTFKNFAAALDFVNRVGGIAEQQGHHPDICFGWGYANVEFYTHKIKGLHENDFIMAAKLNDL